MQASTNDRTGGGDPAPGGAPVDPRVAEAAAQRGGGDDPDATPPPKRITLKGLAVIAGDDDRSTDQAAASAGPDMVVLPAPAHAPSPAPAAPVMVAAGLVSVASAAAPARPQAAAAARPAAAAGDDPSFSDQVMRWMQQGDRLEEARPRKPVDLSDLSEPTDPVAHELFDNVPRETRTQARRRWLAVGAFAVVASIGLYWAAREPKHTGSAVSASTAAASASAIARLARTPDPNAPGAILAAAPTTTPPPSAAVAAKPNDTKAANLAARGPNHGSAGRLHRRRHH